MENMPSQFKRGDVLIVVRPPEYNELLKLQQIVVVDEVIFCGNVVLKGFENSRNFMPKRFIKADIKEE